MEDSQKRGFVADQDMLIASVDGLRHACKIDAILGKR